MPNPFRNYLTPDVFPGSLRNQTTVALGSLLVPYPQYGAITQTNTSAGRNMKTHSFDLRVQRPFTKGVSLLVAYAFQRDRIENFLGDIQEYEVMTSGGKSGWEWQPVNPALPEHRLTSAFTWQIPVGRERGLPGRDARSCSTPCSAAGSTPPRSASIPGGPSCSTRWR